MPQIIDPTAAKLRLIIERMHKHVGDRVYDMRLEAEGLLPIASLSPAEPAETTYAITVDPNDEAAERWFAQADEADLTRTLASARDLARDLDFQLILRDAAGFIRGYVHNDGNYRMV